MQLSTAKSVSHIAPAMSVCVAHQGEGQNTEAGINMAQTGVR